MKRLTLCLALLLSGCAAQPVGPPPSLLGVWHQQDSGNGPYVFAHTAYLPDGRKCVATFAFAENFTQVHGLLNDWTLDNGVITTTFGINSVEQPVGNTFKEEIRLLESGRMDLWVTSSAGEYLARHKRLTDADPERVCELALHVVNIYNAMFELEPAQR